MGLKTMTAPDFSPSAENLAPRVSVTFSLSLAQHPAFPRGLAISTSTRDVSTAPLFTASRRRLHPTSTPLTNGISHPTSSLTGRTEASLMSMNIAHPSPPGATGKAANPSAQNAGTPPRKPSIPPNAARSGRAVHALLSTVFQGVWERWSLWVGWDGGSLGAEARLGASHGIRKAGVIVAPAARGGGAPVISSVAVGAHLLAWTERARVSAHASFPCNDGSNNDSKHTL